MHGRELELFRGSIGNFSPGEPWAENTFESIGCFEGIRCESIEPTLLRFLKPIQVAKHNCIISKLFSPSYSHNFDMTLEKDRMLVEAAVDLDVALHTRGSFGVELNGVYCRR